MQFFYYYYHYYCFLASNSSKFINPYNIIKLIRITYLKSDEKTFYFIIIAELIHGPIHYFLAKYRILDIITDINKETHYLLSVNQNNFKFDALQTITFFEGKLTNRFDMRWNCYRFNDALTECLI